MKNESHQGHLPDFSRTVCLNLRIPILKVSLIRENYYDIIVHVW